MKELSMKVRIVSEDGNPTESGYYLAFMESYGEIYTVMLVPFSVRHGKWNTRDDRDDTENAMDHVYAWTELPEFDIK